MDDITIGQGETIRQIVTDSDGGAVSAQYIATNGSYGIEGDVVPFTAGVANITAYETVVPPGEYDQYVKIIWDDDSVDYLPDFSNCQGECEFPILTVCEVPGVS